jgi:D-aminopeptidase
VEFELSKTNSMRFFISLVFLVFASTLLAQSQRPRDYGIQFGVMKTGKLNAITDVKGVKVGHVTLIQGDSIRTGATVVLPHGDNIFQQKVPAAMYLGNGFGKLAGYSQVEELGNIETPIVLTNTLNVANGINALITYTLKQDENQDVRSVNAIVGETNDGYLNDIRGRHVKEEHILKAISKADTGQIKEGNVGAGTGTRCFGFKGGIGTASRVLPKSLGGYTIGVLVQSNFGGVLEIDGVPIGEELGQYYFKNQIENDTNEVDGSCMIIVMTDAPLSPRNLKRLAKRAMLGLGKTGGIVSNGSGDYVIAVSTAPELRIPYRSNSHFYEAKTLRNSRMSPLFMAVIEATEEAIINSLFAAESMIGRKNHQVEALPIDKVLKILKKYRKISSE